MSVSWIDPNIGSDQPDACREFYAGFLGLTMAMDMGWIATYVSPSNPTAQISMVRGGGAKPAPSAVSISVEVEDVDHLHREALARNYAIVYPLTNEPWGVRRLAVTDPNGILINIMCHLA